MRIEDGVYFFPFSFHCQQGNNDPGYAQSARKARNVVDEEVSSVHEKEDARNESKAVEGDVIPIHGRMYATSCGLHCCRRLVVPWCPNRN
jgi:hypothetical protein